MIVTQSRAHAGDAEGAAVTAQTLRRLYPNAAIEAGEQASQRAKGLLSEQRFAESAAMAGLSLALKPDDAEALQTLGDAEFARARFPEAAAAYQQMLNEETSDPAILRAFADALGSARPANAALELQSLVAGKHFAKILQSAIDTDLAGLFLLTGAERNTIRQQAAARGRPPGAPDQARMVTFPARRIGDARNSSGETPRSAWPMMRFETTSPGSTPGGKDAQAKFERWH
jgi:tetratricopeptide (TPR) repeat protein